MHVFNHKKRHHSTPQTSEINSTVQRRSSLKMTSPSAQFSPDSVNTRLRQLRTQSICSSTGTPDFSDSDAEPERRTSSCDSPTPMFHLSDGEDENDGATVEPTIIQPTRRLSISSSPKSFFTTKKKEKKQASSFEGDEDHSNILPNSKSESSGFFSRNFSFRRRKRSKTTSDFKSLEESTSPKFFGSFTAQILEYPKKTSGYLLMFVMFTSDLTGYSKDKRDMKEFFESIGYTVKEVLNCTREEMFEAIEQTKQELREMNQHGKLPNRLLVSILTHGEVNGILTCKDKQGVLKEQDEGGKYKVTSIEDVISKFKHDETNLPEMKGLPKFFIIQACHGQEVAQAAGGTASAAHLDCTDSTAPVKHEPVFMYQPNLPVDSDLLVLLAATKHNKSFVGEQSGSWLVQYMLDTFRHLHETEEVEQMLKSVTLAVSEKRMSISYADDNNSVVQEVAIQVPTRQSTLRKKFFL